MSRTHIPGFLWDLWFPDRLTLEAPGALDSQAEPAGALGPAGKEGQEAAFREVWQAAPRTEAAWEK